ncbi:MAG: prephenate dehydrogenase/arogenate dehydrogenase family protein [Syntrophorhabdaceae bacterium]|nr:prephenate dehydrogenase/arogenate dehydrogenase family protein [Syntrophorhabdaceae bacterium]
MPRERLGILGLGLIGGSLALALKGKRGAPEVWGCDRNKVHLRQALAKGAISRACAIAELASCDIVVVCIPVRASLHAVSFLGSRMRSGSVLTDVGSVKAEIVRIGERFAGKGVSFVGGHPIAGTENSGFSAADPLLFRGRSFIATPTQRTDEEALRRVDRLWKLTGSKTGFRMDPATHDRVFAHISHLPHVVAYALVHSMTTLRSPVPLGCSAGGFRDFTRIASSNPDMWRDIVLQNRKEVMRAIAHYRRNLDALARRIASSDERGIKNVFAKAKKTRDGL